MPERYSFRLYKDIVLSQPNQPVWTEIGKIGKDRFLILGQLEVYSATGGALRLEISRMGKRIGNCNRGKLDLLKQRKKSTHPHLFGFLMILEETFAGAAWLCRDDEGVKYLELKLLKTKRPPVPEATFQRASM